MSKNNNEIKHEDLIMKKAMDVFAEEGLKVFGIVVGILLLIL